MVITASKSYEKDFLYLLVMPIVTQNIDRLTHLLALYKLTKSEFLDILNKNGNAIINEEDVFSSFIKSDILNKVDKIFNKGFAYYANPYPPVKSSDESIFFRKDNFNSSLNLRSKQVINQFEEEKLSFDTLSKLSDIENDRILPSFTIFDNPVACATSLRDLIHPTTNTDTKGFLKNIISLLGQHNVLVFEFVERPNRKQKANINGFFLSPNVIVLKWQKHTKREVFTLAHEIGHYLLNEEDIDEKVNFEIVPENISDTEKWCNDFAFSFLIGDRLNTLNHLSNVGPQNDYHADLISEISKETHLSTLALYTHLFLSGKISKSSYKVISDTTAIALQQKKEEERKLLELKKLQAELAGKEFKSGAVKEIISPLYIQTLQTALYNGILDEYEFCRKLKIKPDKIDNYLV